MNMILQEIRQGLRQMRKAPVFTIVAVVTLALGIGANTAVFTLFDQALLRSLPVAIPSNWYVSIGPATLPATSTPTAVTTTITFRTPCIATCARRTRCCRT